jgi:hypothetical protein
LIYFSAIDGFEALAKRLLAPPQNVDETVALAAFIKDSRVTDMKMLDEQVELAKKRYAILSRYTLISD